MSLKQLEATVRRDLDILDYPRHEWVRSRQAADGRPILDAMIVGGGQGGLGVAFGLMREKVGNLLVLDAGSEDLEGPWRTFARMITLRTPKHLTGLDGGIPALTIRAWYDAQHGEGAWEAVDLIPKETWADYLAWFRRTLGIPVRNDARVGALQWLEAEGCYAVPVTTGNGEVAEILLARKVILATGIEGSGRWHIPRMITDNLPPSLYAHTHSTIDFPKMVGKRIGILGAGACAFDNASVALEHGAAEVHQFFRRSELVRVNPYRWMEFVGFLKHHADLPDADRWRFISQVMRMGQLPPANTYKRATRFPNHHLHAGSPWLNVCAQGDTARVTTPHGVYDLDYLIVGTGFQTDLSLRPELEHLHTDIALWADRYTPPAAEKSDDLARHPYLGPHYEFLEKTPGTAPHLASVFNYTFGSLPSLGLGGASISGLKYSLPRIVAGVTKQLYLEDKDAYFESLASYAVEDF